MSLFLWLNKQIDLKWALCSVGEEIQTQNFNIYSINEVIIVFFLHNWIHKLPQNMVWN